MQSFAVFKHALPKFVLAFLFWTLIGLSFASQFYLSSLKLGRPVSWSQAIWWSLGDWYVWALMSPAVVALVRRFHLEGQIWKRNLAIHAAASAAVSLAYIVIRAWLGQAQSFFAGTPVPFLEAFRALLFKTFHFNVLIYWVIASVTHAFDYYRQSREREWRAAELERSLTQARLHALQMQLNPHFLFNTLHAIAALMHKDVDAAERMLVRLSELLRIALDNSDAHEVTLRQELEFLDRYVEIEQMRFGDRLSVSRQISPDTLDALVPNLLLQPLVENAIKHGIEARARPGEIQVRARRLADKLELQIADNGNGIAPGARDGVGLSNTRSRLTQLYAGEFDFDLSNKTGGGLEVTAIIPFRRAAAELAEARA